MVHGPDGNFILNLFYSVLVKNNLFWLCISLIIVIVRSCLSHIAYVCLNSYNTKGLMYMRQNHVVIWLSSIVSKKSPKYIQIEIKLSMDMILGSTKNIKIARLKIDAFTAHISKYLIRYLYTMMLISMFKHLWLLAGYPALYGNVQYSNIKRNKARYVFSLEKQNASKVNSIEKLCTGSIKILRNCHEDNFGKEMNPIERDFTKISF